MKLDFEEALELISYGRSVDASEVKARALTRRVWAAEWHTPGCLSESFSVCTTRALAIECALDMCGNIRGALSDLLKHGRTDRISPDSYVGTAIITVYPETLGEIL